MAYNIIIMDKIITGIFPIWLNRPQKRPINMVYKKDYMFHTGIIYVLCGCKWDYIFHKWGYKYL